jgi:DNA-directed RNA polymerase specialized sigma24 family protein
MTSSVQAISVRTASNVVSCEKLLENFKTGQTGPAANEPAPLEASSQNEDLRLFLEERDESLSEVLLALLVYEHAEPVIRNIIRGKLRVSFSATDGSQSNQDALDIGNDVHTLLLTQLRSIKACPNGKSISNFSSYVAAVTYNACYRYLREKYPQRTRLKNRVRYLLTHNDAFVVWETRQREWLCGFALWRAQEMKPAQVGRLQQLRDNPEAIKTQGLTAVDLPGPAPNAGALTAIFNWADGPVELDLLVTVISELYGIKDDIRESQGGEEDDGRLTELTDGSDLSAEVEQRHYLRKLWAEICQLPPRQRAALLLNLRDFQGRGVVALLPLTGVATMRQIADALGMTAETFAGVWNDLPLEDAIIGEYLSITRQQVVNLRKCARQRLARRMRGF